MGRFLTGVAASLMIIGGVYTLSIIIDAASVVRQRFRGPSIESAMPPTPPPSSSDDAQLQKLCGEGAETPCTSFSTGDVVMHGGLGLKGSLPLEK